MTTQAYLIEGMTCGHCVGSVTSEVSGVAGVENAVVDLEAKTVTVTGTVTDEAVAAAVAEAGYTFAGRA